MAATNSGFDSWGYVIVFSRFMFLLIDSGIEKSFGVIIPTMVERLESDYATVGLICSMPPTVAYLICPLVSLALPRVNHRYFAMLGGLLSGLCLVVCAFLKTTVTVGICLFLSGVGLSMTFMPVTIAVNDFCKENYVKWCTVSLYGFTAGSMLLPIVTEKSFQAYGYEGVFIILGGIALHLVVCGATIRKAAGNSDIDQGKSHVKVKKRHGHCSQEGLSPKDMEMFHQPDQAYEEEISKWEEVDEEEEEQENGTCKDTFQEKRNLIKKCDKETFPNESTMSYCGLLKERIFLLSIPAQFLICYVLYAWMLFLVPHAEHLGIPPSNAIYLSTLGGLGGIFGRTIFIILIEKGINDFNIYMVVGSICSGAFLLDFVSSTYPVLAILAFVQGLCFFIEDLTYASLCKKAVFDGNNFDMAVAISNCMCGLGITCAGVSTGYLFDVTQSFTMVFIIIGVFHAIAVIDLIIVVVLIKRRRCDRKGHTDMINMNQSILKNE